MLVIVIIRIHLGFNNQKLNRLEADGFFPEKSLFFQFCFKPNFVLKTNLFIYFIVKGAKFALLHDVYV